MAEALFDVLTAEQFSSSDIERLNRRADQFKTRKHWEIAKAAEALRQSSDLITLLEQMPAAEYASLLVKEAYQKLGRTVMYFWFDEPSLRTGGSFQTVAELFDMGRLGHMNAATDSSLAKGESFADSMRTINEHLKYFGGGVVVMRTKKEGQPAEAAEILDFPVINAGDGQNEHPTQALLDVYTIKSMMGDLDKLKIVMGGDPRYSRTIHSLGKLLPLAVKELEVSIVGDEELWLDEATIESLKADNVSYTQTRDMNVLTEADIVYWTRFQKERLRDTHEKTEIDEIAERYQRDFSITEEIVHSMKDHARILHPLPRGPEIPESVDANIHAAYWEQVGNAIPVRAALVEGILLDLSIERS
jgi:aspartate carbamoyltransferase catalytic subunit